MRTDGSVDYAHPAVRDGGGIVALRIFPSHKPVIGAINGPAVGIGATMTLPMDFRLASEAARFGFFSAFDDAPKPPADRVTKMITYDL